MDSDKLTLLMEKTKAFCERPDILRWLLLLLLLFFPALFFGRIGDDFFHYAISHQLEGSPNSRGVLLDYFNFFPGDPVGDVSC